MAICPICSGPSADKKIAFRGFEVYDLCIRCASYSVCLISPNVDATVKENAIRWADREIANNGEKIYLANCIRSWKQCAEDFIAAQAPSPVQTFREEAREVMDIDGTEINLDATIKGFSNGDYSAVMYQENKHTVDSSVLDIKKESFFTDSTPAQTPVSEQMFRPTVPFSTPVVEREGPFVPFSAPIVEEEESFVPTCSPVIEITPEPEFAYDEDTSEIITDNVLPAPVIEEEPAYDEPAGGSESSDDVCEDDYEDDDEEDYDPVLDYLCEIAYTLKQMNERMARIEKEIAQMKK